VSAISTSFGTIWPDGLGTNCESWRPLATVGDLLTPPTTHADLAGPYLIKFGLESKNSGPVSTSEFKIALAESLTEMRRVCDAAQSAEQGAPPAARL
jgi:hypothetical protein